MRYEHHVSFCGNLIETTVTNKASIADDWVHQILSMYKGRHLVIGLGCKRRPHPITSMGGTTATLQLCVGSKCLILQLLYMDYIPKSLKGFLSNPSSTFVGVEVEENLLKLWGEYGLWCTAAADVHELASRCFPLSFNGETGLKALAYQVAKLHMWKPKNGCCGDWESKLLDEQQVEQVIQTTVTNRGSEVDSWVNTILAIHRGGDMIVGLDCEWRPTFPSGTSNRTATLQLCVDTNCLILQLFYMDYIPQSFKNFLGNPDITFVGVEVQGDALKLSDEYGLDCEKTRDLRALAYSLWPNSWFRQPGLKDLAFQIVGLFIPKPIHVGCSDWEARILSNEQVEYASIDAYASYRIGYRLLKEMGS